MLKLPSGESFTGILTISQFLSNLIPLTLFNGSNATEKAQITDWLVKSSSFEIQLKESFENTWDNLNQTLKSLTFVVGQRLTLADVAVYAHIYFAFVSFSIFVC